MLHNTILRVPLPTNVILKCELEACAILILERIFIVLFDLVVIINHYLIDLILLLLKKVVLCHYLHIMEALDVL